MPKINQEEYEVLKRLDDKWKWIARDELLLLFTNRPYKTDEWGMNIFSNLDTYEELQESVNDDDLFQFIQREDEEPYSIAELIEEYEEHEFYDYVGWEYYESEETEVKNIEWAKKQMKEIIDGRMTENEMFDRGYKNGITNSLDILNHLDEPEQPKITLQDVADKLWELPSNNRKLWLARLNDEFQEGYIVPLGLKTTDGEEQYLTYNGSYFASRRNKYLQQTFDTLEEIPEFYRGLAERVL